MRVVAALSGGVDSSVAALLLKEQGHDVTGVYLRSGVASGPRAARAKQGCCGVVDAADAARMADLLDVPFYSLDYAAGFDTIIDKFAADYAAGRTPNPCILCNRDLKFGELLRFAAAMGADAVATGHYAERLQVGDRYALRRPVDSAKDQTYVLFPLSQDALSRTVFPLSALTKQEVREIARRHGLPVAEKPESMEICFVPGGDYRAILAARSPQALVAGPLIDERAVASGAGTAAGDPLPSGGREVGTHRGVGSVTIGQRRGLGTATGEALYVTRIDASTNRVYVGAADDCLMRELTVRDWNAVAAPPLGVGEQVQGFAKVRRNHEPAEALAVGGIGAGGDAVVTVRFAEPVRAPSPGQALVLYDDAGLVLGGGWIEAARA